MQSCYVIELYLLLLLLRFMINQGIKADIRCDNTESLE